ncbi:sodium/proline symporter [candidate division KSB1 bacterium]|nr:sodium/proline symporter [candidate division KSB1 bacterium]
MDKIALYIPLMIYVIVLIGIGLSSGKENKTVEGYYVAGKKLRYWIISFSTNATGESSWLLLGLTGMGYAIGVHAFWVVLGEVLGVAFCWIFMARRLKVYTDKFNSITVPDYLEDRFDDRRHILRIVSAVILITMVTSYVAAQLTATGKAFKAFLDIDFMTGTIIGLIIVIFYTVFGGLKAVARADFFHGFLMLSGLILLPIVALYHTGGIAEMGRSLFNADPDLLKVFGSYGFGLSGIISVVGFLGIGLAFMCSPQISVRFIAAKNQGEIIRGKYIAILFILIADTGAVLAGMAGRVLYPGLTDQETILPVLSSELFPAFITGIFITIVLAAIISTVDSLLILLSSAVVRDVYQKVFRPDASQKKIVFLGKLVTVIIGLSAFMFSLTENRLIFWFVLFAWAGIGSAFCPVIILSLFWKRITKEGAIAGMIGGFTVAMVWVIAFSESTGLYEMIPGFISSFLIAYVVSLFTQPPAGAAQELENVVQTVKNYTV